jgi:threonine dehydratase
MIPATSTRIDRERIRAAESLIRPHIRRTPVAELDGAGFGFHSSVRLTLKLELMQHTGSFKPRGAFTGMLTRSIPAVGVAAASGGNHGVAVAYAAHKLGVPARIFVPIVSSPAKIARIRGYGAELVIVGERYADSLAASEEWIAASGALPIHAYDQIETLLGQGTVGLEFEEQAPDLDTLLIAVGGGGLIGGVAAWYGGATRIIGVEPELCPTLFRALEAGRPVDSPSGGIAADSLAPRRVGDLMFPIAQRFVERVVLTPDEAIAAAQRVLWDSVRIAAEPGGVTALAALLSGRYQPSQGERIGVLVCGGNTPAVDFDRVSVRTGTA